MCVVCERMDRENRVFTVRGLYRVPVLDRARSRMQYVFRCLGMQNSSARKNEETGIAGTLPDSDE